MMAKSADSVDVTFYYKPIDNPTIVFLPGEFDNWGPNMPWAISPSAPSKMTKDTSTGIWWKTVRLRVGGNTGGMLAGAYEYKFNENGTSWFCPTVESAPRREQQWQFDSLCQQSDNRIPAAECNLRCCRPTTSNDQRVCISINKRRG